VNNKIAAVSTISMPLRPARNNDYTAGWISAIQVEHVIACELLDEEYDPLPLNRENDNNVYTWAAFLGNSWYWHACQRGNTV